MKPTKFPIYILSKGRWESRQTSRTLEEIGIPYRIVVEEGEYANYAAVIDPKKILVLPSNFREDPRYAIPDINGNCGGGIPVRNWIWEHSISEGHEKFWLLDDNIRYFFRSHKNTRLRCFSSAPFLVVEDFTDRFENVMLAGMNYNYFMPCNLDRPPYSLNTRIYSCMLIDNRVKHRFQGRYNEDTNLSLDILKDGHVTFLLNAFTCGKAGTHTMKGGNTEAVYAVGTDQYDGRYNFAKSLHDMHPDCVKITQKFGRWHHEVDYTKFLMNRPIPKKGVHLTGKPNEYGLVLVKADENGKPIKLLSTEGNDFNVIREEE